MKKVGIIILNYNNWEDTIDCVKSVFNINYKNKEVYIVDNLSPNGSFEHLLSYFNRESETITPVENAGCHIKLNRDFYLIQAGKNGGYAAGNNVGIKAALVNKCDYILILNNDSVVTTDFLNILVDFAENNEKAFLCGPKIIDTVHNYEYGARRLYHNSDYLFVPPSLWHHFFKNNKRWAYLQYSELKPFEKAFEIEVLSGSCMLINKCFFDKAGLLDESTFLYMEESILTKKAHALGYKLYCVPEAIIYHAGGKSTATTNKSTIIKHFITACKYFMFKYQHYSAIKRLLLLFPFYCFLWALNLKKVIYNILAIKPAQ